MSDNPEGIRMDILWSMAAAAAMVLLILTFCFGIKAACRKLLKNGRKKIAEENKERK